MLTGQRFELVLLCYSLIRTKSAARSSKRCTASLRRRKSCFLAEGLERRLLLGPTGRGIRTSGDPRICSKEPRPWPAVALPDTAEKCVAEKGPEADQQPM